MLFSSTPILLLVRGGDLACTRKGGFP
uniref:Uncharacterized protein n=1 Tax=Rhizophora mucronata TaxID=61149 RepID=A0A2P2N9C5_RHIMU